MMVMGDSKPEKAPESPLVSVSRASKDSAQSVVGVTLLKPKDGEALGEALGEVVGGRVGDSVGDPVGASVGDPVGASVGVSTGGVVGHGTLVSSTSGVLKPLQMAHEPSSFIGSLLPS